MSVLATIWMAILCFNITLYVLQLDLPEMEAVAPERAEHGLGHAAEPIGRIGVVGGRQLVVEPAQQV